MVHFSYHEIDNQLIPFSQADLISWITDLIRSFQKPLESIDYVFCDDEYVYHLNKEHLEHDYYTDILTFPYSYDPISAEIFISIDRVIDNAQSNNVSVENEILRIIAHGLLHMVGFNDKTDDEKLAMTEAENDCISKFQRSE
jgi:rRNA maturation RNase YbeY